ncbi:MAG: M20/M25/M40 family metallo-hydrolase [Vicinamibacterales bacterium]
MRKYFVTVLVVAVCAALSAQGPPAQQQMKPEDVQKALSLVETPQPVPAKYKAGFDTITPQSNMAMLEFISSDLAEGRDTGTRGYALAADYVVSLFKMWGIKPAGDMPPAGGGARGGGGGRGAAPAAPRERSYFQEITFRETSDVRSTMTVQTASGGAVKTREFVSGVDYTAGAGTAGTVAAPVVFIGYGIVEPSIGFDELQGLDLAGKIVLMLTEAPGSNDPKSPFQSRPELKEKYFPAGGPGGPAPAMARGPGGGQARFNKMAEITKRGPAAIIQVANTGKDTDAFNQLSQVRTPSDERPIINRTRPRLAIAADAGGAAGGRGGSGAPTITVTREIANAILEGTGQTIDELKAAIEKTLKPVSKEIAGAKVTIATTSKTSLVRCKNVLGMIEGSDPKLKDEYFVIGGHFDHNGRWEDYIWNGADDNGSGSIGVVAIAKAMAANPVKPKRTIIFALWTGEERGLLGSRYYVRNPTFPIERTVGYLNYDMISRAFDAATLERSLRQYNVPGAEALVKKIRGNRYATVNLTTGTEFAALTREMNKYVGLDLALRENPLGVGSGGSDHASFASVKIPFVYYMAAMTSDYHQPSDSVEKVDAELFTKIIQMGYLTVFAYADGPAGKGTTN